MEKTEEKSMSGNYNTAEKEVEIVKKLLNVAGVEYASVQKYEGNPDDADVTVTLRNRKQVTVEVKEESYARIQKYGDYGIDFISAFQFKDDSMAKLWKGSPKKPKEFNNFIAKIDQNRPMKRGKIFYSKADLWLFFYNDGTENHGSFFDGPAMTSPSFRTYLKNNCDFAVNNKPVSQESWKDQHHSAVFFIKMNDAEMCSHKVNVADYFGKLSQ